MAPRRNNLLIESASDRLYIPRGSGEALSMLGTVRVGSVGVIAAT
jgi:hypothetical protein